MSAFRTHEGVSLEGRRPKDWTTLKVKSETGVCLLAAPVCFSCPLSLVLYLFWSRLARGCFGFLPCSRSVLVPGFCVVLFLGLWAVAEFVVEQEPTLKLSSSLQVCPGTLCRLHYFLRRYGRAGVIIRAAYSMYISPLSCSAPTDTGKCEPVAPFRRGWTDPGGSH